MRMAVAPVRAVESGCPACHVPLATGLLAARKFRTQRREKKNTNTDQEAFFIERTQGNLNFLFCCYVAGAIQVPDPVRGIERPHRPAGAAVIPGPFKTS